MGTTESGGESSDDEAATEGEAPGFLGDRLSAVWYRTNYGLASIGIFLALTVVTVLIAAGVIESSITQVPGESKPFGKNTVRVPGYVFLYGLVGGIAYFFTSLLTEFDKTYRNLLQMTLRLPAAMLLAAGVFLLVSFFVQQPSPRIVAGMAFLVGLYIKVAIEALGWVARRVYSPTGD